MWKKLKKRYWPIELWASCDIPLQNWEQMNITGDFLWMLKDQKDRIRKKELPSGSEIEEAYFAIYDEYAELTGLHDKMDKWVELMIARMEARVKVAQGHKHWKNFIDDYTAQINNLMKTGEKVDIIENRMLIQQAYGQPIKANEITLREFLSITNIVTKQSERRATKNTVSDGED